MSAGPQTAPLVFDRALGRRRLIRAAAGGFEDFLVRRACGELAERLAAVTRDFPIALDLGSPTDAVFRELSRQPRIGRILRAAPAPGLAGHADLVVDEEALPFAAGSLNLAVSLLALQAVNDLPGALAQLRRSLAPDGLFIGCLIGGASLAELRQAMLEAESEIEGGASPRVAPFADIRDMGALLQRAGFALPVTDVDNLTVRYSDPLHLLRDLRRMGLTSTLAARSRKPLRRATLLRALTLYRERFSDADGRVRASFDLIWLSGWAPHASQQQPLRPGSARSRLADALKAVEISAGEKPGG